MGRPFAASIPPQPPYRTIVELATTLRASEQAKYRVFISLRNVHASGWGTSYATPAPPAPHRIAQGEP